MNSIVKILLLLLAVSSVTTIVETAYLQQFNDVTEVSFIEEQMQTTFQKMSFEQDYDTDTVSNENALNPEININTRQIEKGFLPLLVKNFAYSINTPIPATSTMEVFIGYFLITITWVLRILFGMELVQWAILKFSSNVH